MVNSAFFGQVVLWAKIFLSLLSHCVSLTDGRTIPTELSHSAVNSSNAVENVTTVVPTQVNTNLHTLAPHHVNIRMSQCHVDSLQLHQHNTTW